jgi:hypothetical protein
VLWTSYGTGKCTHKVSQSDSKPLSKFKNDDHELIDPINTNKGTRQGYGLLLFLFSEQSCERMETVCNDWSQTLQIMKYSKL